MSQLEIGSVCHSLEKKVIDVDINENENRSSSTENLILIKSANSVNQV